MLATPFEPLSDEEFRQLAAAGLAIPCQQGSTFFVAKWKDGPGLPTEGFLSAIHAEGSSLMVRRFKGDVNIRVIRRSTAGGPSRAATIPLRPAAP